MLAGSDASCPDTGGFAQRVLTLSTGPTVTKVSSITGAGSYNAGDTISVQVAVREAVTVTGTPTLALNSGGIAAYTSGSGTSTLTFTYTVGAG